MSNPIKIVIKLVEDSIGDVMSVQELLRNNPLYDLECFIEPNPFLAALSNNIDIVITDLRMDDYNPMEAIKKMHDEFPGIRVLVVSAVFTNAVIDQLFWFRVDGIIRKEGAYWPDRLMEWLNHLAPSIIERKMLTA